MLLFAVWMNSNLACLFILSQIFVMSVASTISRIILRPKQAEKMCAFVRLCTTGPALIFHHRLSACARGYTAPSRFMLSFFMAEVQGAACSDWQYYR